LATLPGDKTREKEEKILMLSNLLIGICGILHFGFMILEMFLWSTPKGLKIFRQTRDKAEATKVLAANQGIYNGVLAVGLFWSITVQPLEWGNQVRVFFLLSVLVVGFYGAWTVSRTIFWVQAFPAALALTAVLAGL
jgi:putative membrane protein